LSDEVKRIRFERLVLPHADAAYSLAIWLMRSEAQAEEAVQEAYLRAFRFFEALRGEDARPWLLGIVRNTCYTMLKRTREGTAPEEFDEDSCGEEALAPGAVVSFPVNPETAAIESADRELVQRCLQALPEEFREALVLREIHGCSYKEIASITAAPMGTVMSRISRGRRLLQSALTERVKRKDTGT
jgi:RNA polymerase sigma-70 factor, ECF subfamily